MTIDAVIKKRLKKLKEALPDLDDKELERELLPLPGDEVKPKILRKRVKK